MFCFSSLKSKNSWPLFLFVGNVSCYSLSMLLHSFFLLAKTEFLLGSIGLFMAALTWLSTSLCFGHSALFGQNQNWILFLLSLQKKFLILVTSGMMRFCNGLAFDSVIYFVALIESVITVMLWVSSLFMTRMRLIYMVISLALTSVAFIVWI